MPVRDQPEFSSHGLEPAPAPTASQSQKYRNSSWDPFRFSLLALAELSRAARMALFHNVARRAKNFSVISHLDFPGWSFETLGVGEFAHYSFVSGVNISKRVNSRLLGHSATAPKVIKSNLVQFADRPTFVFDNYDGGFYRRKRGFCGRVLLRRSDLSVHSNSWSPAGSMPVW